MLSLSPALVLAVTIHNEPSIPNDKGPNPFPTTKEKTHHRNRHQIYFDKPAAEPDTRGANSKSPNTYRGRKAMVAKVGKRVIPSMWSFEPAE